MAVYIFKFENTNQRREVKFIKDGDYWIDRTTGNRWSRRRYNKRVAVELSKKLIDCRDCTDCTECLECIGCKNCHNCFRCLCCSDCTECEDCSHAAMFENKNNLRVSSH